jgi:hypothetical protein
MPRKRADEAADGGAQAVEFLLSEIQNKQISVSWEHSRRAPDCE